MDTSVIDAKKRSRIGTASARFARHNNLIPGVLYGHGKEAIGLVVSRPAIEHAIFGGVRILTIKLDGAAEQALIREVQYDALGSNIIHVDFGRVAADETITLEISVELRGTAKGTVAGGVVDQPLHRVPIQCRVDSIPEAIRLDVTELEIGQSIRVRDLKLAEGQKVMLPGETVVVMVHEPKGEEEAVVAPAEAAEAAEPEVIRAKKAEEEEGDEKTEKKEKK
jgi:large subunit ribosomal protein L25